MQRGLLMKYFVLKPKGTDAYAAASRAALNAYANIIIHTDEHLAKDLLNWSLDETENALKGE